MSVQDWFCFENDDKKNNIKAVEKLPIPYNSLESTRLKGVKSKYTTPQNAPRIEHCTLSYPPIQAMHEIILAKAGADNGSGIGKNGSFAFAQLKVSDDDVRLASYSFANGLVMVNKYNPVSDTYEQLDISSLDKNSCTAIFMALYYTACNDTEFMDCFNSVEGGYSPSTGFEDRKTEMGMLCDNLYRRLKDQNKPYSILSSGTVQPLTRQLISMGRFVTDESIGDASVLQGDTDNDATATTTPADNSDFIGKYRNPNRILTAEEKALVPEVKSHIIIPAFVKTVCKHIQLSFNNPIKMGNAMFRGIAGTGKTTAAKLVAAGMGLPYGNVTCSADTQIFDLLGSIIPDTSMSLGNDELDAERQKYMESGGFTFENVCLHLGLPNYRKLDMANQDDYEALCKSVNMPEWETVDFDPVTAYEELTGIRNPNASAKDCVAIMMKKVIEKVVQLNHTTDGKPAYRYVETPLVKAIKYGWVCEIQEPTVILQQGVLVGLNSLLEQDGNIVLPTGEVIKRHPDAVIILTTNTSYEGCRAMNQSVTDRMNLIFDIPNPNVDSLSKIAMQATGCAEEAMVRKMAQCVLDIETYCKNKYITDGSVGLRGLIDWTNSYMITGDVIQSARLTVLSKATTDENDRDGIFTSCVATIF